MERLRTVIAAMAALACGTLLAQPPEASAPATAAAATAPARPSDPAFLALAAKADQVESVHAVGSLTLSRATQPATQPAESVDFEVWARPPRSRQQAAIGETRVSDGQHIYALRRAGEGYEGRRRQLRPDNFYHALDRSAIFVDALNGYRNLLSGARFASAQPEPGFGPDLKWFVLEPSARPPHHIFWGCKSVKIALGPDGLPRVLIGRLLPEKPGQAESVVTIVTPKIEANTVKDADLLLPPAAAGAAWTDADDKQPVTLPKELVGG